MVFEVDGSLRYVGPSMERVLGYAPEELLGAVVLDLIHPEDLESVVARSVDIWDSPGVAPPFVFRFWRKDGSVAHLELAMNNLLFDPNFAAVVTIIRDVTERVWAEEEARRLNEELERRMAERTADLEATVAELKKKERLLNAAFEGATSGMAQVSPDGRYSKVNDRLCEIMGYSREELLSTTLHEIARLRDTLRPYSFEKQLLRKDGSYAWISLNVSPSYERTATGEPHYFVLVAEDIDARKKAELVLDSLSLREKEVLLLLARGKTNPQIREDLKIGLGTVKYHLTNIFEKLGAEDRTQAAVRAGELDLLSAPIDTPRP